MGKESLNKWVAEVMERRNQAVANYLRTEKQLPNSKYIIYNAKPDMQLQRSAPPKFIINLLAAE
jgi:hypothetical protein